MSSQSTGKKRGRMLYQDEENASSHVDAKSREQFFASDPIHDRSSTFVAHFHPASTAFPPQQTATKKTETLTATVKRLQNHSAFHDASHRIVAWRRRSAQTTLLSTPSTSSWLSTPAPKAIYTTNSDDDGEKYAGKRLEKVLAECDVDGVIVCARWYGGVLLGPVRFTHIENVARQAITRWRSSLGDYEGNDGVGTKKVKIEPASVDDSADRARLAKILGDRDSSIAVLRSLLAEKTASTNKASQQEGSQASAPAASPAKKVDYADMPLARLKALEKAKDATLTFILKQIDKAEEEAKMRDLEAIADEPDDIDGD